MRKALFSATAVAVGMTFSSCLNNDDSFQAGFIINKPSAPITGVYANNVADTLNMQCMGPWQITSDQPGDSWCTISQMSGKGSSIYSLPVLFEQNTTGRSRSIKFTIRDTDHPNDAYTSWYYLQYATRGDGSLGNAQLVKKISSSDGWQATIGYDKQSRPVSYKSINEQGVADDIVFEYSEQSGTMNVRTASGTLTGHIDNAYQLQMLTGERDTIGYYSQYYSNGVPMSANDAFSFIATHGQVRRAYSYLLNGQSLNPDSLHCADSLRYQYRPNLREQTTTEMLKLKYSQQDNRCQSVDVNQLLLGFDNCEPLQLLSLFRYTRSTSIVSQASTSNGTIDVTTELNGDKSVSRMVVKDNRSGKETTYLFEY